MYTSTRAERLSWALSVIELAGVTKNGQQVYERGRATPGNFRKPVSAVREPRAENPAGHQRQKRGAVDCTAAQAVAAHGVFAGLTTFLCGCPHLVPRFALDRPSKQTIPSRLCGNGLSLCSVRVMPSQLRDDPVAQRQGGALDTPGRFSLPALVNASNRVPKRIGEW